MTTPTLSVLVMAYNEADNVTPVVHELTATLRGLGVGWELVIINDGSSDATGPRADALAAALPGVRVLHHAVNQGLGGVYRSGFATARGDYLTFFPADGEFPATILAQFLPLMADADMVLGYLHQPDLPAAARLLAWGERLLYRLLFGALPRFQGVLMFRRELLAAIPLTSTGRAWTVLMELILRTQRAGYRIRSVPTALRPRLSGESKVNNWRTIVDSFKQLLALQRSLNG
ncbi:MAG: glycosyltransferase [Anaerolineae bacterium]